MGLFSLEKSKAQGHLIYVSTYLEGGCEEMDLVTTQSCPLQDKSQRTQTEAQEILFQHIYIFFFSPVKLIKHWNRVLREVLGSLALRMFKTGLDTVLSNLL